MERITHRSVFEKMLVYAEEGLAAFGVDLSSLTRDGPAVDEVEPAGAIVFFIELTAAVATAEALVFKFFRFAFVEGFDEATGAGDTEEVAQL